MEWIDTVREAYSRLTSDPAGARSLMASAIDESRSRDVAKQREVQKRYGSHYKGLPDRVAKAGFEAWREGEHAFVLHSKKAPDETKMKAHGAAAAAHGLAADAVGKHAATSAHAKQLAKLHRAAEAHHNEKADEIMAGTSKPYRAANESVSVDYRKAIVESSVRAFGRKRPTQVRTAAVVGGKKNIRGLFRTGLKRKK